MIYNIFMILNNLITKYKIILKIIYKKLFKIIYNKIKFFKNKFKTLNKSNNHIIFKILKIKNS